MASTFYRWFAETAQTRLGRRRRHRIQVFRHDILTRHISPPGDLLELGPGEGDFSEVARAAGWRYRAIEASPVLAAALRARGVSVKEAWVPPIGEPDSSADVVYADQMLEHMPTADAARALAAEAFRVLRPGGVFSVTVPDYLKERAFFWDVDYTHNFVTTPRRVSQLLYDAGFSIERLALAIGRTLGLGRVLLATAALLANLPGVDTVARATRQNDLLFKMRKNLFQTVTVIARKPRS